MASSVQILQAQLREATAEARLVNAKLRAHRLSAGSCRRREKAKRLHLRQVGLRIVALVDHDEEKVLDKWLSVKLPLLQGDERCNLLSNILDEFTALEIDDIVRMEEPIALKDKILLEKAKAEIAKCELHSWVCRQNVEKGLAPTVGALIRQRDAKGEEAQGVLSSEPRGSRSRSSSYKWISRWRKKWRMPKAKIQDRDSPTPSEMREKVWPRQCPSWQSRISRCAPHFWGKAKSGKCGGCLQERGSGADRKTTPPGYQIVAERGAKNGPFLGAA